MFDYTKIGYTQTGENNTKSGMHQIRYEEVKNGKLNTKIASEFTKKHPMYKKYGVKEMIVSGYGDSKPEFYTLRADVFGENVEFRVKPRIFSDIKPNEEVAKFLQRLKRAVKYKPTSFLENVAKVARHIK